jgi:hypothetical protein
MEKLGFISAKRFHKNDPSKAPVSCPAPPAPPASSKLLNTTSANLMEFDTAVYTCTTGYTLVGVTTAGVSNNQVPILQLLNLQT